MFWRSSRCLDSRPVLWSSECAVSSGPQSKCFSPLQWKDQIQSVNKSSGAEWETQTRLLKTSHHGNIRPWQKTEIIPFANLFSRITVPFCQTDGQVQEKAPVRIPSSSLTEVWSAQTWTLGTLFTHIIVTCKPPCRKHKIHLYILYLQAMTAETEQGEKKKQKEGRKLGKKCRFEAGPYSQRQKC